TVAAQKTLFQRITVNLLADDRVEAFYVARQILRVRHFAPGPANHFFGLVAQHGGERRVDLEPALVRRRAGHADHGLVEQSAEMAFRSAFRARRWNGRMDLGHGGAARWAISLASRKASRTCSRSWSSSQGLVRNL